METLKDLVGACRDREGVAVDGPHRTTPYSYREFGTNCWKVGNLYSHYGVRPGASMSVVVGPNDPTESAVEGLPDAPQPLLAVLGGTGVGATVTLAPSPPVEGRALVVPAAWFDRYEAVPGCSVLAYGSEVEDPTITQFETEFWSENPIEPPDPVSADDDALTFDGESVSHGRLLDVARTVQDEYGIDADDAVALGGSLTGPGAVVAGVLAPLVAGATILVPDGEGTVPREEASLVVGKGGDIAVEAVTTRLRDAGRA